MAEQVSGKSSVWRSMWRQTFGIAQSHSTIPLVQLFSYENKSHFLLQKFAR